MFQIKMAQIKLAQLLNKKREKEVLMGFQKTKNCRDRKKLEKRAEKKREASPKRYHLKEIGNW